MNGISYVLIGVLIGTALKHWSVMTLFCVILISIVSLGILVCSVAKIEKKYAGRI